MTRNGKAGLALAAGFILIGAASFLVEGARAASEDAWAEFRQDVEAKCLQAAKGDSGLFTADARATVDPFGSESFGLALIEGPARGAEDLTIRAICVYDKQGRTVEMGGELPA